ncbi:MAG: AAA family ATPase [Acidimicrobiia bacterium]
MDRFIITGAPGTGKTSLLRLLGADFETVDEPARELLAEFREAERDRPGDQEFVELILRRSIEKYVTSADVAGAGPVFFDRGLPDCVAYAKHLEVHLAGGEVATGQYRCATDVFIAPVWEKIYTNDEERQMTITQVQNFHRCVVEAYRAANYRLVELPRISIADRAAFIRSRIGR